jgi:hypothetical protein
VLLEQRQEHGQRSRYAGFARSAGDDGPEFTDLLGRGWPPASDPVESRKLGIVELQPERRFQCSKPC